MSVQAEGTDTMRGVSDAYLLLLRRVVAMSPGMLEGFGRSDLWHQRRGRTICEGLERGLGDLEWIVTREVASEEDLKRAVEVGRAVVRHVERLEVLSGEGAHTAALRTLGAALWATEQLSVESAAGRVVEMGETLTLWYPGVYNPTARNLAALRRGVGFEEMVAATWMRCARVGTTEEHELLTGVTLRLLSGTLEESVFRVEHPGTGALVRLCEKARNWGEDGGNPPVLTGASRDATVLLRLALNRHTGGRDREERDVLARALEIGLNCTKTGGESEYSRLRRRHAVWGLARYLRENGRGRDPLCALIATRPSEGIDREQLAALGARSERIRRAV